MQPIYGKDTARDIKYNVKLEIARWNGAGLSPRMAVVLASSDPASLVYVQSKKRTAESLGIALTVFDLGAEVSQQVLENTLHRLSDSAEFQGVMLEFPLAPHLDPEKALAKIAAHKDVEGLSPANLSLIATGREKDAILAPTPHACILLAETQGPLIGKRVAVIGPGRTVGRPLISMLINRGATVTVVTEHTRDVRETLKDCEVVFVCVGKHGLLKKAAITEGQIVIDAGINVINDGLKGDADPEIYPMLKAYSPVPGGVGVVTSALIFQNFVRALELQAEENGQFGGVHDPVE